MPHKMIDNVRAQRGELMKHGWYWHERSLIAAGSVGDDLGDGVPLTAERIAEAKAFLEANPDQGEYAQAQAGVAL